MPTYAPMPAFVDRRASPRTLAAIVLVHAAVLTAVITAKVTIDRITVPATDVTFVPLPKLPPPPPPAPIRDRQQMKQVPITRPIPKLELPNLEDQKVPAAEIADKTPPVTTDPTGSADGAQLALNRIRPAAARTGPRFATPDGLIKPPYPSDKLRNGEEAALKLRLTIDERGRVVAVDSIGAADPSFLAAARRHLIARWRYKPAMEGDRPVASSTVITLKFQLDNAL